MNEFLKAFYPFTTAEMLLLMTTFKDEAAFLTVTLVWVDLFLCTCVTETLMAETESVFFH